MMNLQAGKIEDLKGDLTGGFKGEILLPSDGAYDSARRIWNGMIDKHPAIIARCATTSDVVRGVNFARDNRLLLAVRGGGHHIAGNALCDDGLVIDLSKMKAARVDPAGRRVTIEGGATLADLDARHPSSRPRHAGRHQLHHRHSGADARWGLRLAQSEVRNDDRQSRVRRGRNRGR